MGSPFIKYEEAIARRSWKGVSPSSFRKQIASSVFSVINVLITSPFLY